MDLDPDEWWHSLSVKRRQQIYQWVDGQAAGVHTPTPGQRELFDTQPSDRQEHTS